MMTRDARTVWKRRQALLKALLSRFLTDSIATSAAVN